MQDVGVRRGRIGYAHPMHERVNKINERFETSDVTNQDRDGIALTSIDH